MPCGECIIMLQDIAIQLGLPVISEHVAGSLIYNRKQVCDDFWEVLPLDMKGQRLSLPWLTKQFAELPLDADVGSVHRYARAYFVQLIRGFLFAYKSSTLVHSPQVALQASSTIEFQMNWTLYTPDIMTLLPDRRHNGKDVWTYLGPMIIFHIVKWHVLDHVL
ncbi:serine/threonine-protein phosphatase 7 long form-like protein [Cucumis melo var. makuwa]|uniref:Serine/threonine-protein phosphatase 7 long form-like protein n=1 Tax=Cucumis melo var. makuwa TaxID=1194695 RepID=A0A5D3BUE3_CUCMM|nr:serine/threonine-protein phosphatase 7 long form-like protein [Cucumis melo var. makuwa]